MFKSMFGNMKQEDLVDLMKAYDYYIFAACDSGILDTDWRPVGICEFYENEYQNVWDSDKEEDSFNYMYADGV